jgi:hypothetical protein
MIWDRAESRVVVFDIKRESLCRRLSISPFPYASLIISAMARISCSVNPISRMSAAADDCILEGCRDAGLRTSVISVTIERLEQAGGRLTAVPAHDELLISVCTLPSLDRNIPVSKSFITKQAAENTE